MGSERIATGNVPGAGVSSRRNSPMSAKLLRNSLAHRHPVHYKCLLRVILCVIEKVERPHFSVRTFDLSSATVFSTKVT